MVRRPSRLEETRAEGSRPIPWQVHPKRPGGGRADRGVDGHLEGGTVNPG